jgi:hypothetical protein
MPKQRIATVENLKNFVNQFAVSSVNGKTGDVSVPESPVYPGIIIINGTGNFTVSSVPFQPSSVKLEIHANRGQNRSTDSGGGSNVRNSISQMTGIARDDGTRQAIGNAGSGNSINEVRKFSTNNKCILMEYSGKNGGFEGSFEGDITSFNADGFTINMSRVDQTEVVIFTAYT